MQRCILEPGSLIFSKARLRLLVLQIYLLSEPFKVTLLGCVPDRLESVLEQVLIVTLDRDAALDVFL